VPKISLVNEVQCGTGTEWRVIRNILTVGFSHFGLAEGVANAFQFGISNGQAAKLGCVTLYSLCSRESGTAGFIEVEHLKSI